VVLGGPEQVGLMLERDSGRDGGMHPVLPSKSAGEPAVIDNCR
jgi:hypothetical protein